MKPELIKFLILGMTRDAASSLNLDKLAYEIKNMRLIPNKDETAYILTNELGTTELNIKRTFPDPDSDLDLLRGEYLGHAVLNNYLIVFTNTPVEGFSPIGHIFRLELKNNDLEFPYFLCRELVSSRELKFYTEEKQNDNKVTYKNVAIETLPWFESEDVLKVYWVDGINLPRFINFKDNKFNDDNFTPSGFDVNILNFKLKMSFNESCTITKNKVGGGLFPTGIIQYAFSYFNYNGSESAIFYLSPLYQLTLADRGGSPEETSSNTFDITLTNLSKNWDGIKIYSIIRSTYNGHLECKVYNRDLNNSTEYKFTDNNVGGASIDPTILLYLNEASITALTLETKDNVLFLGNVKLNSVDINDVISDTDEDVLKNWFNDLFSYYCGPYKTLKLPKTEGVYTQDDLLDKSSEEMKFFKYKEYYRFGILVLSETGEWSEPIFLGDKQNDKCLVNYYEDDSDAQLPYASIDFDDRLLGSIFAKIKTLYHAVKIRPIVVYPTISDRSILCQGIACPTVFNAECRKNNVPFALSSWFARPNLSYNVVNSAPYMPTENVDLYKKFVSERINRVDTKFSYTDNNNTDDTWGIFKTYATKKVLNSEVKPANRYEDVYTIDNSFIDDILNINPSRLYSPLNIDNKIEGAGKYLDNPGMLVTNGFNYNDLLYYLHDTKADDGYPLLLPNPNPLNVDELARYLKHEALIKNLLSDTEFYNLFNNATYGTYAEFRHYFPVPSCLCRNAEIQCIVNPAVGPYYNSKMYYNANEWIKVFRDNYFIDLSIITLHSPDILFNTDILKIKYDNYKTRVVGFVPFVSHEGKYHINTVGAPMPDGVMGTGEALPGEYTTDIKCNAVGRYGSRGITSGIFWIDNSVKSSKVEDRETICDNRYTRTVLKENADADEKRKWWYNDVMGYNIYPWHKLGIIRIDPDKEFNLGLLKNKRLSNIKYSNRAYYFGIDGITPYEYSLNDVCDIKAFDGIYPLVKLKNRDGGEDINYYGEVNYLLTATTKYPIVVTTPERGKFLEKNKPLNAMNKYGFDIFKELFMYNRSDIRWYNTGYLYDANNDELNRKIDEFEGYEPMFLIKGYNQFANKRVHSYMSGTTPEPYISYGSGYENAAVIHSKYFQINYSPYFGSTGDYKEPLSTLMTKYYNSNTYKYFYTEYYNFDLGGLISPLIYKSDTNEDVWDYVNFYELASKEDVTEQRKKYLDDFIKKAEFISDFGIHDGKTQLFVLSIWLNRMYDYYLFEKDIPEEAYNNVERFYSRFNITGYYDYYPAKSLGGLVNHTHRVGAGINIFNDSYYEGRTGIKIDRVPDCKPPTGLIPHKYYLFEYPIFGNSGLGTTSYNIDTCVIPWSLGADSDTYKNAKKVFLENKTSNIWFTNAIFGNNKMDTWEKIKDNQDLNNFSSGYPYYGSLEPVSIKYKSTPHIVIELNYDLEGNQLILPAFNDNLSDSVIGKLPTYTVNKIHNTKSEYKCFWNDKEVKINLPRINVETNTKNEVIKVRKILKSEDPIKNTYIPEYGYLWLVELYKDYNPDTAFGGTSKNAILNNLWLPCGEAISFDSFVDGNKSLKWTEGDTYYLRYDCMKTYPYTYEDLNLVTEIVSFMCETKINLLGRYDKNIGLIDNTTVTPANFNLFNQVYTLPNNFFLYNVSYRNNITDYPTTVVWSLEKFNNADKDVWTATNMNSSIDLDGLYGLVNAIKNYHDLLLAFQDNAVCVLDFNPTVALSSALGVPVEISNSMKMNGKKYLFTNMGCTNKWSIAKTNSNLYWIDDNRKKLYSFNTLAEDGNHSLSGKFGFNTWIKDLLIGTNPYYDYNNFRSFVDFNSNEVYFNFKNKTSLNYTEELASFLSFYDYDTADCISNILNRLISLRDNKIYLHLSGDYNMFYDTYKPYHLTLKASALADSIFTNILYFLNNYLDGLLTRDSFNYIQALTDYLDTGKVQLTLYNNPLVGIGNLRDKFRTFRIQIPRDKNHFLDRIRNPWVKISLFRDSVEDGHKFELLDINLIYYK